MPQTVEPEGVQAEHEEALGHLAALACDVFVPMCCCVDVMQLSILK